MDKLFNGTCSAMICRDLCLKIRDIIVEIASATETWGFSGLLNQFANQVFFWHLTRGGKSQKHILPNL